MQKGNYKNILRPLSILGVALVGISAGFALTALPHSIFNDAFKLSIPEALLANTVGIFYIGITAAGIYEFIVTFAFIYLATLYEKRILTRSNVLLSSCVVGVIYYFLSLNETIAIASQNLIASYFFEKSISLNPPGLASLIGITLYLSVPKTRIS